MQPGLSIKQKASLTAMYARNFLMVSGICSLSAFIALAVMDADRAGLAAMVGMLSLMKLFLTGILVLLKMLDRGRGDREFFYINLGLYPRRMTAAAVILDLAVYAVGLTVIILIKNALQY